MRAQVVAVALVLFPALALADNTFEQRAAQAKRLVHLDEVLWAATASCDKGDDTLQRQCRRVRQATLDAHAGALVLVDGEPDAFEIGAWNAAKKSLPLRLAACVRCKPVDVDGKKLRVAPAKTAALYDNAKQFPDEPAAVAWAKLAKAHRVELLVKLPDKRWPLAGGTLTVDVVGYRVIAVCDGSILAASPPSQPVTPDKKACAVP